VLVVLDSKLKASSSSCLVQKCSFGPVIVSAQADMVSTWSLTLRVAMQNGVTTLYVDRPVC